MRISLHLPRKIGAQSRTSGWLRDEQGATAVEFGLVALPFFLFILGILGIGLYFFTTSSLEHGAEAAARKIRTGEAQKGALTVGDFKKLVCEEAGSYIDCDKLRVVLQHGEHWSDVSPISCIDSNGDVASSTGSSDEIVSGYTGAASEVVLVTLCYEWDLAESFSFIEFAQNSDGAAILQAATAFRTEPYS
jgi:TadE-like protein